jgi:hypothetical protein
MQAGGHLNIITFEGEFARKKATEEEIRFYENAPEEYRQFMC